MSRRGTETRAMANQAFVRMDADLAQACAQAADRQGLTLAAWLRGLAVAAVDMPGSARPSAPIPAPDPLVADLSLLVRSVGRMNGAVVQFAKAMRETSHPDHPTAEEVLGDLRATQRALVGLVQEVRRDRGRHEG